MFETMFRESLPFWVFCFGTFLSIQYTAAFFSDRIVTKRGNELREEIKLRAKTEMLAYVPDVQSKVLLDDMVKELVARGNASLSLVARFTEYHYISIISTLVSGTLGGIATFLISYLGWGVANFALKGFFVGCAASLPFWLTVTQVFKYQETIAKHEAIYIACCNLASEINLVVLAPPEIDEKGQPFKLSSYLASFARRLEGIRSIGVTFDGSKIGVAKIDFPK